MGKYAKILAALDALPPEAQRLTLRAAWSTRLNCGCLFGTLIPGYPRDTWSLVDFRNAYARTGRSTADDPHLGPAGRWFGEVGLTYEDVDALQTFNDMCLDGEEHATEQSACAARFRRVREHVAKLAAIEAGREAP